MAEPLIYCTRREFIQGSLSTLSVAATMPAFLCRTANLIAAAPNPRGRILVVVQLAGGNDGLNMVVPHGHDAYYRARPQIAIPAKDVLPINPEVGLHPRLTGLKALLDCGQLSIVQGVGYPNPNRSHFKSMDIWHTADPAGRKHTGWLGRYFDGCCSGAQPKPSPQSAVALTAETPLALSGEAFAPVAFEDESSLAWKSPKASPEARTVFETLNSAGSAPASTSNPALDFLRRSALDARLGADDIHAAARGKPPASRSSAGPADHPLAPGMSASSGDAADPTSPPAAGGGQANASAPRQSSGRRGSLAGQLDLVARMITADFPTRVYYVTLGGFDTHANQQNVHARLLQELGDALHAFVQRLQSDKLLDRVLVLTFSEFGRRVAQNASAGTDHGAAAPMILAGSGVHPGVHLEHPSLTDLDDGDLILGCDFRRVYAAVLRDWLQADPERILGAGFPPLKIIEK